MRLYKRTFKQENRREVENTDKKSWIAIVISVISLILTAINIGIAYIKNKCNLAPLFFEFREFR